MAKRNVIIEVKSTPQLAEMAEATAGLGVAAAEPEMLLEDGALLASAAASAAANLPGVELDPTFGPVQIPRQAEIPDVGLGLSPEAAAEAYGRDQTFDPYNVEEEYTLEMDPKKSTYLVRGEIEDKDLKKAVDAAERSPQVVRIYSDVTIEVCRICPGDPPLGTTANVASNLGVPALRRARMDGSGVRVAIVDTGINMRYLNSVGMRPRFDAASSWVPRAGLTPGDLPVDHGTMCAYDVCIAAPNCTLIDVALLLSRRPGSTVMEGLLSDAVLAYRHLLNLMGATVRPGVNPSLVVNNSWGMFHPSWDFPVGHSGNYSHNPNHPFNLIVGALARAGADIYFAAGNCGRDCPDGRCRGVTSGGIYGANAHPLVTCVAGVDVRKDRVGYSTSGPGRLYRWKPDIASYTHFRGSGVYAADGGTSAATPVAAGVAAALRTRIPFNRFNPLSSPLAIRNRIIRTAEDRGATGFDFDYGWGIINGTRLVRSLVPRPIILEAEAEEAQVEEIEEPVTPPPLEEMEALYQAPPEVAEEPAVPDGAHAHNGKLTHTHS